MKRYICQPCIAGVHCKGSSNGGECECEECQPEESEQKFLGMSAGYIDDRFDYYADR